jgi:biotin operon repressor
LLTNIANTNEQLVIDFYQKVYYNCTVVKVLHLFFIFMEIIMLKDRILKVLKSGRQFTPAQLAGMTGTTEDSIRPRISELRSEGFAIYTNSTKNGKTAYRLGTPSRKMVAAAYHLYGSEAFARV